MKLGIIHCPIDLSVRYTVRKFLVHWLILSSQNKLNFIGSDSSVTRLNIQPCKVTERLSFAWPTNRPNLKQACLFILFHLIVDKIWLFFASSFPKGKGLPSAKKQTNKNKKEKALIAAGRLYKLNNQREIMAKKSTLFFSSLPLSRWRNWKNAFYPHVHLFVIFVGTNGKPSTKKTIALISWSKMHTWKPLRFGKSSLTAHQLLSLSASQRHFRQNTLANYLVSWTIRLDRDKNDSKKMC